MIVFSRNRLQPNLRHHIAVNDVDVRRLADIRRIKPELVALNFDRRHNSSRSHDGFVFERGEDAFENPFAVVAAKERFAGAFKIAG